MAAATCGTMLSKICLIGGPEKWKEKIGIKVFEKIMAKFSEKPHL